MEQEKSFLNEFEEKEKTSTLKTLTVLTFIGSGLVLIFAVWGFLSADSSYQKMKELVDSGKVDQLPAFARGMYSPERMEVMRKSVENKVPLFIVNMITGVLCIVGAIRMRKLKEDGYWIWLMGELLPFLAVLFFIGADYFTGITTWITFAIVGLFVILYSLQKKHLTK